jgi:hypothetical protein
MYRVPRSRFPDWALEMWMRLDVCRVGASPLSVLFQSPAICPLPTMQCHDQHSMKLILTDRDRQIVRILTQARWLTTEQLRALFFPEASANACQKRLRKLVEGGFIFQCRRSRTEQSLWRAASQGIVLLQSEGIEPPSKVTRVPQNLSHFSEINTVRTWFIRETPAAGLRLALFRAEWEIKAGNRLRAIPDALAVISGTQSGTIAIEVDLGTEGLEFFVRTKLKNYDGFTAGDRNDGRYVLVIAHGRSRMKAIASRLYGNSLSRRFLLSERDQFLSGTIDSPTVVSMVKREGKVCCSLRECLVASPHKVSSREEEITPGTA